MKFLAVFLICSLSLNILCSEGERNKVNRNNYQTLMVPNVVSIDATQTHPNQIIKKNEDSNCPQFPHIRPGDFCDNKLLCKHCLKLSTITKFLQDLSLYNKTNEKRTGNLIIGKKMFRSLFFLQKNQFINPFQNSNNSLPIRQNKFINPFKLSKNYLPEQQINNPEYSYCFFHQQHTYLFYTKKEAGLTWVKFHPNEYENIKKVLESGNVSTSKIQSNTAPIVGPANSNISNTPQQNQVTLSINPNIKTNSAAQYQVPNASPNIPMNSAPQFQTAVPQPSNVPMQTYQVPATGVAALNKNRRRRK